MPVPGLGGVSEQGINIDVRTPARHSKVAMIHRQRGGSKNFHQSISRSVTGQIVVQVFKPFRKVARMPSETNVAVCVGYSGKEVPIAFIVVGCEFFPDVIEDFYLGF